VLVLPALAEPIPRLDAAGSADTPAYVRLVNGMGHFICPFNYLGLPSLTLPPFALGAAGEPSPLPASVLLTNLPAVSTQGTSTHPGSPGTCEAQAFGYGRGSSTAARLPDGVHLPHDRALERVCGCEPRRRRGGRGRRRGDAEEEDDRGQERGAEEHRLGHLCQGSGRQYDGRT
jgi:hypothetical protein